MRRDRVPTGRRKLSRRRSSRCGAAFRIWGRKLQAILGKRGPARAWPAPSTMGDILKRAGLIEPARRRRRPLDAPRRTIAAEAANDEWAADFKGWFRTRDQRRVDPLTITDSHAEEGDLRAAGGRRRGVAGPFRRLPPAFKRDPPARGARADADHEARRVRTSGEIKWRSAQLQTLLTDACLAGVTTRLAPRRTLTWTKREHEIKGGRPFMRLGRELTFPLSRA